MYGKGSSQLKDETIEHFHVMSKFQFAPSLKWPRYGRGSRNSAATFTQASVSKSVPQLCSGLKNNCIVEGHLIK